jgi:plastocyanin
LTAAASTSLVVGVTGVSNAATKPAVTTASVKIQNYQFKPKTLTIVTGTKVTWKNYDGTGHDVVFKTFGSPILATGGTWSHKFATTGTFKYHCSLHPDMTAKVVVTP